MKKRALLVLGLLLVVGSLSACQGGKGGTVSNSSNASASSMTSVEGQSSHETTKGAQDWFEGWLGDKMEYLSYDYHTIAGY